MSTSLQPSRPAFRLRRAELHDAPTLARLAERTFREAFADDNTAEDVDLHCRQSYTEQVQADEIARQDMVTWLCEGPEGLVGYAQLRWGRAPACVVGTSPGEIQRLYVDQRCHGAGVAQRLMQACLDELRARGSDVAWLGVWERNPRAIAFYRKFGFVEVGEHRFTVGRDPQRDLILVRPV